MVKARGPAALYDFHDLGDRLFEEACCFLLTREPGITGANRHNAPRQEQHGVDVIGECNDQAHIEVVSCKCYQSVTKGDIAVFGDEFLRHYESHWKSRNVRRFILAVACDLKSSQRQSELEHEKVRFARLGLKYDYWDVRKLTNLGRPHPQFRRDFFNEYPSEPARESASVAPTSTGPGLINAVLAEQLVQFAKLQKATADLVGGRLDGMQESVRAFGYVKVRGELESLVVDQAIWPALPAEHQARVLRMQALDCLCREATDDAEKLAERAEAINNKPEQKVRALVAYQRGDLEIALAAIASPESAEGAMLRTAMLIEFGRLDEAEQLIQMWSDPQSVGPEWHRMRTLLFMLRGDIEKATEELGFVKNLAPEWASTHYLLAVFDYRKALSPAFEFRMTGWPDPVHFGLVLRDDASQRYLTGALQRFDLLLSRTEPGSESNRLAVWRLACLCNLTARDQEAEAYCKALLRARDFPAAAVFFALAGGMSFDRNAIVRALESRITDGGAGIDDLQALVACRISNSQFSKAHAALDRYEQNHHDSISKEVVDRWRVRLAMRTGSRKTKRGTIADRVDALLAPRKKGIDQEAAEAIVRDPATPPAEQFAACVGLAGAGKWQVVREVAANLAFKVRTAESVRLAAYAFFNTGAFEEVEPVVEANRNVFPAGDVPLDLRRMLAVVMIKGGKVDRAIAAARELAGRTGSSGDLLNLARIHVQAGDAAGAIEPLKELVDRHNWTVQDVVPLLPAISSQDEELARHLLRRVLASDTALEQAGAILPWAHRLGLGDEASELMSKTLSMGEDAARRAGLVAASLEDVLAYMKEEKATHARFLAAYRSGLLPIHVMAPKTRVNIAALWDSAFRGREIDPPLMIRNGNRPADFFAEGIPEPPALWLDTTALLTAHHLDLLDTVLASFPAISVPKSLQSALQHIEEELHHQQPSRLTIHKAIAEAVNIGQIAVTRDGERPSSARIAVRFPSPIPVPGVEPEPFITLGTVLNELERRDLVSTAKAKDLRALGDFWHSTVIDGGIEAASRLEFDAGTLEQIFATDLVEQILKMKMVSIDVGSFRALDRELGVAEEKLRIAHGVATIRTRMADALFSGRCMLIPDHPLPDSGRDMTDPVSLPFLELIGTPGTKGRWLWVDDRMLTVHAGATDCTILSTFEMLDCLRKRRAIVDDTYFGALYKLRQSCVQIIPIRAEEVLWCLQRSTIENGLVQEANELQHLRRSLNRTLLMKPDLQIRVTERKVVPEVSCIVEAISLLRHVLDAIWSREPMSLEDRVAWSDWAWWALRLEWLDADLPQDFAGHVWFESLARLLLTEIGLPSHREDGADMSVREQYVAWLRARIPVISGRASDSEMERVVASISLILTQTLAGGLTDTEGAEIPRSAHEHLIVAYCNEFPDALRSRLQNVEPLRSIARAQVQSIISAQDLQFEAKEFWAALELARKNRKSTLVTVDSKEEYSVNNVQQQGQAPAFEFSGRRRVRIQDEAFALLADDVADRIEFLLTRKKYICPPEADAAAELERIARLDPPHARIEAFKEGHTRTAAGRYRRLDELLEGTDHFPTSALGTVESKAYLADLGLSPANVDLGWEALAESLVAEYGFDGAMERMRGLPIPLPRTLKQAFTKFDIEQRDRLLVRESAVALTPMAILRALELLFAEERPDGVEICAALLKDLLANRAECLDAFCTMLRWSHRVWMRDPSWWQLPPKLQLSCVWTHAERTFDPFVGRAKLSWIREYFDGRNPLDIALALRINAAFGQDVAAPRHINPPVLLAHLVGLVLPDIPGAGGAFVEDILQLLSMPVEGAGPKIQLYADPRDGLNSMHSFLQRELPDWLSDRLLLGDVAVTAGATRDQSRRELLDGLERNPQERGEWIRLSAIEYDFLRPDEKTAIQHAIAAWKFPEAKVDADGSASMLIVAHLLPQCGAELRAQIEEKFWLWIEHLSRSNMLQAAVSDVAALDPTTVAASEMLFGLAHGLKTEECILELGRLTNRLIEKWPTAAPYWRKAIERALEGLSHDAGRPLWPVLLRLRSLC